jgi:hypothetical protein
MSERSEQRLDPIEPERNGKRALFGPVAPPMDHQPPAGEGRQALFSAAPRRKGDVVVECSACEARSPVSLTALGIRMVPSLWLPIPGRAFTRFMRCPACNQPTWCKIHWRTLLD